MTNTGVRARGLLLGLALCVAYVTAAEPLRSAPVTAPMGRYGILLNQWPSSNTGNDKTSALLGVLDFDGDKNVTATYSKVNRDFTVKTGTAAGTYSANTDGSCTINLTFDDGSVWTMAAAVTDSGSGLQLIVTGGDPMNAFPGNPNPAEVWSGTGRTSSSQGTVPSGSFGYVLTGWPDSGNKATTIFGVMNIDSAGNLNATYIVVNGRPVSFPGTLSGTYSVNPDGTGKMNFNLDSGLAATVATVVTEGGAGILMSGSVGDQVTTGTARLQ